MGREVPCSSHTRLLFCTKPPWGMTSPCRPWQRGCLYGTLQLWVISPPVTHELLGADMLIGDFKAVPSSLLSLIWRASKKEKKLVRRAECT